MRRGNTDTVIGIDDCDIGGRMDGVLQLQLLSEGSGSEEYLVNSYYFKRTCASVPHARGMGPWEQTLSTSDGPS